MENSTENLVRQVNALIAQLDHSNQRFDQAIVHQQETVRRVQRRNRMLMLLISVMVVGLIGIGAAVGIALNAADKAQNAADKAQNATEATAALLIENEADREQSNLVTCRLRNNTNLVYRSSTQVDINETAELLAEVGVEPDVIEQYVEARESAIPKADVTDRDCNGDNVLDEADYPSI